MVDTSRRRIIRSAIAASLFAATSASLIDVARAEGRVLTVKTQDGKELRIRSRSDMVELVSGGKVVDARPTGTFTFANGQTLSVDNGVVSGGTAVQTGREAWLAFALLPAGMNNIKQ